MTFKPQTLASVRSYYFRELLIERAPSTSSGVTKPSPISALTGRKPASKPGAK